MSDEAASAFAGSSSPRDLRRLADEDVVREVAGGDQEAFTELYDRYAVRVHGLVRRVVRAPSPSEEVTREVFVEAWRTARSYDPGTDAVADWLLTMAHLRAIDRVRADDQTARERAGRACDRQLLPRSDQAGEHVVTTHRHESIRAALGELTDLEREAIELAYFRGPACRDTAALLDTAPATVQSALRDALMRLSRASA